MDIKIFQEKLEQILAQAREQDKTLSGQDIREVFGEELSAVSHYPFHTSLLLLSFLYSLNLILSHYLKTLL